jgi:ATP-binding cassette subfamily F protein uup
MDEPTNDLDMETLDLLEEVLLDYQGTIIIVSHDRQFLNNVVTSIIALEGSGVVNEYVGGYDDWVRQKKVMEKTEPEKKAVNETKPQEEKPKVRKLSYKEKQEINALPDSIEKMESQLQKLHEAMADPAFYKKNQTEIAATGAKADELQKLLDNAYARWQELEALK